MCSFRCYEDLPTCGEGGCPTHGGYYDKLWLVLILVMDEYMFLYT